MSLLDHLRTARAPKTPVGWLTLEQLAKKEGRPNARGSFYYIAQAAVAAGLLEKKTFRIMLGNGVRPVAHYRRVK